MQLAILEESVPPQLAVVVPLLALPVHLPVSVGLVPQQPPVLVPSVPLAKQPDLLMLAHASLQQFVQVHGDRAEVFLGDEGTRETEADVKQRENFLCLFFLVCVVSPATLFSFAKKHSPIFFHLLRTGMCVLFLAVEGEVKKVDRLRKKHPPTFY